MEMVVHCKKSKYDVYIGRPSEKDIQLGINLKWGNPFEIGIDGNRKEVIRKYRDWIITQDHLIKDLHELNGKVLGCWCKPKSCHGDVLRQLIEYYYGGENTNTIT